MTEYAQLENLRPLVGVNHARSTPRQDLSPIAEITRALRKYYCSESQIRLGKAFLLLGDVASLWLALCLGALISAVVGTGPTVSAPEWMRLNETLVFRMTSMGLITVALVAWFWGGVSHYTNRKPFWDELKEILLALAGCLIIDAALLFLFKHASSRIWLVSLWLTAMVLIPLVRFLVKKGVYKLGWLYQPYVIVGNCDEVGEAIAALNSQPLLGFRPVAVINPEFNDSALLHRAEIPLESEKIPVYPLTPAIRSYLMRSTPLKVVFVPGKVCNPELLTLAQQVALKRDDVYMVPTIAGLPLYGLEMFNFFSHEVLFLRVRNNLNRRIVRLAKRGFDIFSALFLLLLLSPLLALVAYLIKRESPGPAIFSQHRVGYDGKNFRIYKFRSMYTNADEVLESWKTIHPEKWAEYVANNFKLAEDPRITPVGKWIRRTSIDELPQIFNVFVGDMSLVGPRPLLPRELDHYGDSINIYSNVRPGITGLWQISGRSKTTFNQRITLDRWYIRNWSFWHDLVILIRTVRVVLKAEGAH